MSARADLLFGGSATDLVPGTAHEVEALATEFDEAGQRYFWAASDLGKVTVTWTGTAGDGFRSCMNRNGAAWSATSIALSLSAKELKAYADKLRSAQQQARHARNLFEEGLRLAADGAAVEFERQRSEAAANGGGDSWLARVFKMPARAVLARRPEGHDLRDEACTQLTDARRAVAVAGTRAAAVLAGHLADRNVPSSVADAGGTAATGTSGRNPNTGDYGSYQDLYGPVPLFPEDLDPTNINQGQVGDCWFLAGAGAVAFQDPQWIKDHITLNRDGTYTVTLYRKVPGTLPWDPSTFAPVDVRVDSSVLDSGVKDRNGLPSWLSVYEKAAAEFRGGSYGAIDGGFQSTALEMVTGRPAQDEGSPSLESIQKGLADGRSYATASKIHEISWLPLDVSEPTIVPRHAYMIDRVETRNGELMIHLINPWGPDGGSLKDGVPRAGDLWLTEKQFHDNFRNTSSVSGR